MRKAGRLELTWIGKYEEKFFEPRILLEDTSNSWNYWKSKTCQTINNDAQRK